MLRIVDAHDNSGCNICQEKYDSERSGYVRQNAGGSGPDLTEG